jgi:hypothetical protein
METPRLPAIAASWAGRFEYSEAAMRGVHGAGYNLALILSASILAKARV